MTDSKTILPLDEKDIAHAKRVMTNALATGFKRQDAMKTIEIMNEAILSMAAETLVMKTSLQHGKPGGVRKALVNELDLLAQRTLNIYNQMVKDPQNAQRSTVSQPSAI